MSALCQAFDWRLDLREMAYFAHWLTPALRATSLRVVRPLERRRRGLESKGYP